VPEKIVIQAKNGSNEGLVTDFKDQHNYRQPASPPDPELMAIG
jgi:hypothetical protein